MPYAAFFTNMAISRQNEARSRDYAIHLSNDFKGSLQSTSPYIDSTTQSIPLNILEHCICTNSMANIRPGRMSNSVPLSFKPQPYRISHRGRLHTDQHYTCDYMLLIALKKKLTQIRRSASHKRISGCSNRISGYSICGRCVKLNRPSVKSALGYCPLSSVFAEWLLLPPWGHNSLRHQ